MTPCEYLVIWSTSCGLAFVAGALWAERRALREWRETQKNCRHSRD